jgi:hypothetical protein
MMSVTSYNRDARIDVTRQDKDACVVDVDDGVNGDINGDVTSNDDVDNNNDNNTNTNTNNNNMTSRPDTETSVKSIKTRMGTITNKAHYGNTGTAKGFDARKRRSGLVGLLFGAIPEYTVMLLSDEKDYRKVYECGDDFVDFRDDVCCTPRSIVSDVDDGNGTSGSRTGRTTARSWVSSVQDDFNESQSSEPVNGPVSTIVDKSRLYTSFDGVRQAFIREMTKHGESQEVLERVCKELVLEKEVNVVQRLQVKKEEGHTKVLKDTVEQLRRDIECGVKESEEQIDKLYYDIDVYTKENERVSGEKMQIMYKLNRLKQELVMKNEEIQRFETMKEKVTADSIATQKNSDVLQVTLKVSDRIQKTGVKDFEELSYKLSNNKKLVDSLILRVDKAKADKKMWEHRYKVTSKDLSHVQSIITSMSTSATETQAALYRDRGLHYLKSVGGGGGIKESVVRERVAESEGSILTDALKAPELRSITKNDGRAAKEGDVMMSIGSNGGASGGGGGGGRRRNVQTPDVRVSKKKLNRYIAKSNTQRGGEAGKKKDFNDLGDDLGLGGNLVDGSDEDFITLLKAETVARKEEGEWYKPPSRGDGSGRNNFSRMSNVSAVSGLSGVTNKTDMSEGSSLRWKTGVQRKRREKGEGLREEWVESIKPSMHNYVGGGGDAGFVGGDGEFYQTGVKQVQLDYELPF